MEIFIQASAAQYDGDTFFRLTAAVDELARKLVDVASVELCFTTEWRSSDA